MASQVDIINRACTKLGAARISSLEDASKQARTFAAIWDTVRQAELRKNLWSFAMVRVSLPSLAEVPGWGFSTVIQLPSDFLRLVNVGELYVSPSMSDYIASDTSPYAIEGKKLQTIYSAPLKIRYVRDVTNTGDWDSLFVESMAAKLAYEGCEDITQSNSKKEAALKDYQLSMREAVLANAVEKPSQGIADDSWILARL